MRNRAVTLLEAVMAMLVLFMVVMLSLSMLVGFNKGLRSKRYAIKRSLYINNLIEQAKSLVDKDRKRISNSGFVGELYDRTIFIYSYGVDVPWPTTSNPQRRQYFAIYICQIYLPQRNIAYFMEDIDRPREVEIREYKYVANRSLFLIFIFDEEGTNSLRQRLAARLTGPVVYAYEVFEELLRVEPRYVGALHTMSVNKFLAIDFIAKEINKEQDK